MQATRGRRLVTTMAVVAAAMTMATTPPAEAAPRVAGSLRLADAAVPPASTVTLSGALPPRRPRPVSLQTKVSGTWKTVARKRSGRRGGFSFSSTSPGTAGPRAYRVSAPATTIDGRRYPALVTPTRTLTVVTMVAVDAAERHACAVASDHSAWCWGSNQYGELGDGRGTPYDVNDTRVSRPVRVLGGDWADISTAGASTCGLKRSGTAWCWGENATFTTSATGQVASPAQVAGSWRQITAGVEHACGVKPDGTGWCWGLDRGQLGTDQPVGAGQMVQLPGQWLEVEASGGGGAPSTDVTCGVRVDRSAWCWGRNGGRFGDGTTDDSAVPVAVAGGRSWAQLSVGGGHTCGVTTDGSGWCWGGNTDGRLGNGTFVESLEPVRVTVAAAWRTIDAGLQHTCGVTVTGTAWCWGWNGNGQVGNGTSDTVYYPAPVPHQLSGTWRDIAAGYVSSAGVRSPGRAWAWGRGSNGETGRGVAGAALTPVEVAINP